MATNPVEVVRFIGRNSKRVAVSVVGSILVLVGVAMLVLPGPGIVVVAMGFAVLGTEYAWAAAALERTKSTAGRAGRTARKRVATAGRTAKGAISAAGRRARRR
ncbi:MAG: PGPGW domain-containing protein [Actinomycetota bacterium]|nr:PGPGW domain-containing protein [Actinomycetota bacterium]